MPAEPVENLKHDYFFIGQVARLLSMLLALVAGGLHVATLWQHPLSLDVILDVGRGITLLLLAMGLMGTARLSLILAILFCSTSLLNIGTPTDLSRLISIIEVALIILATVALLLPIAQRRDTP